MATFGSVGHFDEAGETWILYVGRLEQFFIANDVDQPEKRRAIFLTVVGPNTFRLLHTLLSPTTPSEKTYEELVDVLNSHYNPAPSEIVERYKFNSRIRKPEESVTQYISELRQLAQHCNYGFTLNVMLRDRIVCGIQNQQIPTKLLAEPGLTLEKASQIATAMETASRDVKNLQPMMADMHATTTKVNKIYKPAYKGSTSYNHQKGNKDFNKHTYAQNKMPRCCIRCGGNMHTPPNCPFKDAECFSCGKTGHISSQCRTPKNQTTGKVGNSNFTHKKKLVHQNQVQHQNDEQIPTRNEFISSAPEYSIFNIQENLRKPPEPTVLEFRINGAQIKMELDTGAAFSVIAEDMYRQQLSAHKLKPVDTQLHSFTGHAIPVLGCIEVQVDYLNQPCKTLPLLVVKGCGASLCGRNWISAMNLVTTNVNQCCTYSQTLQNVLEKHKSVFEEGPGKLNGVQIHLAIKDDAQPIFCKARSVPYALKEKVSEELDRLTHEGILQPVRHSEWATPIVTILKADKEHIRICGDYKQTINPAAKIETYPLPRAQDIYAKLSGGKKFSKLDLKEAYSQLELDAESRNLTVINTHKGLYQYTRLPYGISSASAIFQREMDILVQDLDKVSSFQDDILVTGKDDVEHIDQLDQTLTRIESAGLKIKLEKCSFFNDSVVFLGNRIDKDGLHPDVEKIRAIKDAPAPENVQQLRSFLGLVNYYGNFIPQLALHMAPLHELLQKSRLWEWNQKHQHAFEYAKQALQETSCLTYFDPDKPIYLACDASPYGIGAVLSHKDGQGIEKPIAFASRSLATAEKNYSHLEREALAIIFGVTKFHDYLFGRKFILTTDHKPLVTIFNEKKGIPAMTAARLQRWALTLAAYVYEIQYKPGSANGNADALSRLPLPCTFNEPPKLPEHIQAVEAITQSNKVEEFIEHSLKDSILQEVLQKMDTPWRKETNESLRSFWLKRHELSTENGLILRGIRLVVPTSLRQVILQELHAGHQGIVSLKNLARTKYWWPHIDKDIENLVRQCNQCQQVMSLPSQQDLQSWPEGTAPWTRIHVDYAGPCDNKMLLVVVDPFTGWIEACTTTTATSLSTVIRLREMFARFGLPYCVVTDNGPAFTGEVFDKFMKENNISHSKISPYHPQSNGPAERAVGVIKTGLKKLTSGTVEEKLAKVLLTHRRTPSAVKGKSPAELLLGRTIRTSLDLWNSRNMSKTHNPEKDTPMLPNKYPIGTQVWCRNYGKGQRWISGQVIQLLGRVMYKVQTMTGELVRHKCQMRQSKTMIIPRTQEQEPPFPFMDFGPVPLLQEQPQPPPYRNTQQMRKSTRPRKQPKRLNL